MNNVDSVSFAIEGKARGPQSRDGGLPAELRLQVEVIRSLSGAAIRPAGGTGVSRFCGHDGASANSR